jgi:hypothetical protein
VPVVRAADAEGAARAANATAAAIGGKNFLRTIAEAFLATDLVDVTMLIAHHFPGLRREAQTWPQDQAAR